MGKSNNNGQDIHDRHPSEDSTSDKAAKKTSDKPNFSWPGEDPQAVRDSFYKENGVKADLTGGTVPDEE